MTKKEASKKKRNSLSFLICKLLNIHEAKKYIQLTLWIINIHDKSLHICICSFIVGLSATEHRCVMDWRLFEVYVCMCVCARETEGEMGSDMGGLFFSRHGPNNML